MARAAATALLRYHIMAGLGTYFALLHGWSLLSCCGAENCFHTRWILWPLMLSFPFPYIANTAGWMTAEIGRQPWLVYGLIRPTRAIPNMSRQEMACSLCSDFMGMYTVLSILFIVLVYRIIASGPEAAGDCNCRTGNRGITMAC